MGEQSYPFTIGDIEGAVLLDGVTVIGAPGILKRFPDASEADYRRAYEKIGGSLDDAVSSLNVLMLRMDDETLLVDGGEGGDPRGGALPHALREIAVEPEEVTLVVLTHSHGDHVLGLLSPTGTPTFPNARYVMTTEERAFWRERIEGGLAAQRAILDMMEARGLREIGMEEVILRGLTAVPLPGHTPGHIGLQVESGGERLLHLADLIHSPMQFAHPEWSPTFDVDTQVSIPTRRTALARAADVEALSFLYHLPFPGLGRVEPRGQGFAWTALDD